MRKLLIIISLLVMFTGIATAAEGVMPGHSYIQDGTTFAVELVNSVNSKNTFVGEALEICVLENVVIADKVVIEEGSIGYVLVTDVKKAQDWGKEGGIEIQPQYVRTVNSIKVPLANYVRKSGEGHNIIRPFSFGGFGKKFDGSAVRIGAMLLFADFSPGKNAEIPAGTKFLVAVSGNVDLMGHPGSVGSNIDTIAKKKNNWTGKYSTSRGKLLLTQDGNKVTGTYDRSGGKVEGSVVGDKLVGRWTEEKSKVAPNGKGSFEFKMAQDEKLVMKWRNDDNETWIIDPYAAKL